MWLIDQMHICDCQHTTIRVKKMCGQVADCWIECKKNHIETNPEKCAKCKERSKPKRS